MTTLQKNFFSQPITRFVGERTADLQGPELLSFIEQLHDYMQRNSLETIQNNNFFYWLTYALYCSVKSTDTAAITIISAITIKILDQDPKALERMFQNSVSEGVFKEQSFFYVWMNNYYSLTYSDTKDFNALLAFDLVFKKLLEAPDFNFCAMLVKENEGNGPEGGKNALLALLRALLQSVTLVNNRAETALIAELFQKCMRAEPEVMGAALTQEFTRSLFKGKSNLYVLFCALLKAGAHDPSLVMTIQEVLLQTLHTNPQSFFHELCKINALGPYKGISLLHMHLLTLVESAYIKDNSATLAQLMAIFSRLDSDLIKEEHKLVNLLLEPIKTGEYNGLNGMMFLTRALIAGVAHNLDVEPIEKQITHLIRIAPAAQLISALSLSDPQNRVPEYTISSLMQLIKQVDHSQSSALPPYLTNIFNSISPVLIAQLSATLPRTFIDKFNGIYAQISNANPAEKGKEEHNNDNLEEEGNYIMATKRPEPTFFSRKKMNKADEINFKDSTSPKRQL